jgi:hypothetical protein
MMDNFHKSLRLLKTFSSKVAWSSRSFDPEVITITSDGKHYDIPVAVMENGPDAVRDYFNDLLQKEMEFRMNVAEAAMSGMRSIYAPE